MSPSATPSTPSPAGDDRNLVAVDATTAVTFEDKLHLFWRNNRTLILGFCAAVLLLIAGKGVWDIIAREKELDIEKAYAAATTNEQLQAFINAHPNHPLGGIAQLRLADEAYTAGKSDEAIAGYEKAGGILKTGPLAARAKLGRAVAKAQAGKTAEATTELKQILDDAAQFKSIRAESAYHLTSLAVEAGNATEAQKLVDQLNQIDPMGAWAQRAIMLRATLPPAAAEAAPATTSSESPSAPAAGTKQEDTGVKVDLPKRTP